MGMCRCWMGHLYASLQANGCACSGRNGCGKSTLLRVLAGLQALDQGDVRRAPDVRTSLLEQDIPLTSTRPVFDVVAEGLGDLGDLVAEYHHAAVEVAEGSTSARLERLGRLQLALEERDGWRLEHRCATL